MLSINTNISSLVAQNSMKSATQLLNQAVERMTTGYKINHAKDNAANYSISQNMNIQLSSYDVAADNVAMGMDLVNTASDMISLMQDYGNRLQALCTQARNGTYGQQSLDAINTEAAAIMAEINRLYQTAEYNNVSLFNRKALEIAEHLPQAGKSGFIDDSAISTPLRGKEEYGGFIVDPVSYTEADIATMVDFGTVDANQKLASGTYAISSVEELIKLAEMADEEMLYDSDNYCPAGEYVFVLTSNIDLKNYTNWNSIDNFYGTFDGNGHIIENLNGNKSLFGYLDYSGEQAIKNLGLVNVDLVGCSPLTNGINADGRTQKVENCFTTGIITGGGYDVGGLLGNITAFGSDCIIENCYSEIDIDSSATNVGGLVGYGEGSISLKNCYTTGNITGQNGAAGIGILQTYGDAMINCYTTGNIISTTGSALGLGGYYMINCFTTGDITGKSSAFGLSGSAYEITDCYSTGNITSDGVAAGLVSGNERLIIKNSYSTGNISGKTYVAGLASSGGIYDNTTITNCYASGNLSGKIVGGILSSAGTAEYNNVSITIKNCASYSKSIIGTETVGSIIGKFNCEDSDLNTTAELIIKDCETLLDISSLGIFNRNYVEDNTFDKSVYDAERTLIQLKNVITSLQVGIHTDESSRLSFDTNFDFDLTALNDLTTEDALATITEFQKILSEKSTALGAIENRLDSALESIEVNINNLTSSRSTIRDADIAEVSSEYIRQQILQQASATLMATANQSPSIALQLI